MIDLYGVLQVYGRYVQGCSENVLLYPVGTTGYELLVD